MDFEKIIINSIDETVKSNLNKDDSNLPVLDNEHTMNLSKQDKFLMSYSNILLKNYHQELMKELAKSNVQI